MSLGRQESAEQTCKPARDSGIKIEKDRWIEGDENRGTFRPHPAWIVGGALGEAGKMCRF